MSSDLSTAAAQQPYVSPAKAFLAEAVCESESGVDGNSNVEPRESDSLDDSSGVVPETPNVYDPETPVPDSASDGVAESMHVSSGDVNGFDVALPPTQPPADLYSGAGVFAERAEEGVEERGDGDDDAAIPASEDVSLLGDVVTAPPRALADVDDMQAAPTEQPDLLMFSPFKAADALPVEQTGVADESVDLLGDELMPEHAEGQVDDLCIEETAEIVGEAEGGEEKSPTKPEEQSKKRRLTRKQQGKRLAAARMAKRLDPSVAAHSPSVGAALDTSASSDEQQQPDMAETTESTDSPNVPVAADTGSKRTLRSRAAVTPQRTPRGFALARRLQTAPLCRGRRPSTAERSASERRPSVSSPAVSLVATPTRRRQQAAVPLSEPAPSGRRRGATAATRGARTLERASATQRRRGGRGGGRPGASQSAEDPYSVDDNLEEHPAPFVNLQVDRTPHGGVRFSKATSSLSGQITSKFASLEQSAEARRRSLADTERVGSKVTPKRRLTENLCRQISPRRSTPSTGELADVSSLGSRTTSGNSAPRSTPSNGQPTQPRAPRDDSALFSDINERLADDDDDVQADESATPSVAAPSSVRSTPRSMRGKRRPAPQLSSQPKRRRHDTDEDAVPPRVEPQVVAPQLTADEQLRVDRPDSSDHAALLPGARVLARWIDKAFYSGTVVSKDGLGRYRIAFADSGHRDMPVTDVIPISMLDAGKTVMIPKVIEGEDALQPVEIRQCPTGSNSEEWFEGIFNVYNQDTEAEEKVRWMEFVIDGQQVKQFPSTRASPPTRLVVADNIESSRTRLRRPVPLVATSALDLRRVRRSPAAPRSEPRARGRGRGRGRRSAPITFDAEASAPPALNVQPLQAGVARTELVGSDDDPPELFSGCRFVLTSANRRGAASPDEERPLVAFNKREVRQMIEQNDGHVVDDFSKMDGFESVFLVADTHYRTHKYLSALSRAIPCVSHTWIHNCVQAGKRISHHSYTLPGGVSLESGGLIEWHSNGPRLLVGKKVLVHTENRPNSAATLDFVQIWTPLVRCMGATLVDQLPPDGGPLDILLTDGSCPATLLAAAKAAGAIAVSSEWLIQAIITGDRPRHDAHEKYRYDFVEGSAP